MGVGRKLTEEGDDLPVGRSGAPSLSSVVVLGRALIAQMVRHATLVVVAVFAITRLAAFLIGVRLTIVSGWWQLFDLRQLRRHLFTSLFYLHAQPPLFNLVMGVLVHFRGNVQPHLASLAMLVLGLTIVLSTLFLTEELTGSRAAGLLVALLLTADPTLLLYEDMYFYTYATTAGTVVAALALIKFWRRDNWWWALLYCLALAFVILANSSFQLPWMLLALAPIVWRSRSRWRMGVAVLAIPLALVGFWYGKNLALFGTYSTSSWLGMNLARPTLNLLTPVERSAMVNSHELPSIALQVPFDPVNLYVPSYQSAHQPTGQHILDSTTRDQHAYPNYNNINYVAISQDFLHADLDYIRARPLTYLTSVSKAVRIFVVPGDQYQWVAPNRALLGPWVTWFDRIILLQPVQNNAATFTNAAIGGQAPAPLTISYTETALLLLTLFGIPPLIWRRRLTAAARVTLGFLWLTTTYLFLVSSLLELGENNRFAVDIGPLPALGAIMVVGSYWRIYRAKAVIPRDNLSPSASPDTLNG